MCVCVCVCERERQTDRQTDRQRQRQSPVHTAYFAHIFHQLSTDFCQHNAGEKSAHVNTVAVGQFLVILHSLLNDSFCTGVTASILDGQCHRGTDLQKWCPLRIEDAIFRQFCSTNIMPICSANINYEMKLWNDRKHGLTCIVFPVSYTHLTLPTTERV